MIALQHDRSRGALIAVEGPAGDAGNGLAVDDALTVKYDRDDAADQGYLHGLPFTRFPGGVDARRQKAIDAADLVAVRFVAVIILDLHLVTAAQVNAAVASLRIAELRVQFEVVEFLLADQVVAGSGVDEQPVSDDPAVFHGRRTRLPAGQGFTVEKLDALCPDGRLCTLERGGARSGPRELAALFVGRFALQQVVTQASLETLFVFALLPLRRHAEANLAVGELDARDGPGAPKTPDKGADQGPPAGKPYLQPGRILLL